MEKMTQHQLGQIKKDIQPSWCWAKVSEANDLILNPDEPSLLVTHYSSLLLLFAVHLIPTKNISNNIHFE